MNATADLKSFREETREWLESNCPQSMRNRTFHFEDAHEVYSTDDAKLWLQRAAAKGWTAPSWETKYGSSSLDRAQAAVLNQDMKRSKPFPRQLAWGL